MRTPLSLVEHAHQERRLATAARREPRALQRRLRSVEPFVQHLDRSGYHDAAAFTWHVAQDSGERLRRNLTFEGRQEIVAALDAITSLTKPQRRAMLTYRTFIEEVN